MLESAYIIAIESFFVVVSGLFLLLYSARIREVVSEERTASGILSSIVGSLEKRIYDKDERLLDLLYRVDLLESRFQLSSDRSKLEHKTTSSANAEGQKMLLERRVANATGTSNVTMTGVTVLRMLLSGPKTSGDIRKHLGKSREHVARIMKGLYEDGYVTRSEDGKPFVYDLTESGRSLANES